METKRDAEKQSVMPAIEGLTPEYAGNASNYGLAGCLSDSHVRVPPGDSLLPDKDKVYYNDYSTLVQQQGMLQDHVRTSIYQFAMLENRNDFLGKTVLDVGAGSGILSFFAARAGAKKVYAVEASGMAVKAAKLAKGNGLDGVVEVLHQKVEDVQLKERVDVLISEPLGIALVNERMLESYLHARDMLLKPGGKMYPDKSELFAAPFSDEPLYSEQYQKAAFWTQPSFYGVDLSALRDDALTFYFSQPVVGPVAPHTIAAAAVSKHFDFTSMSIDALQRFDIPLRFTMPAVQQIHGIALWFDCTFPGSQKQTVLSTSPVEPLTHWYQVRCLLQSPLAVGVGHSLSGNLRFEANESRGYNVHMTLTNDNTGMSLSNTVVTQCALHHFQYTTQQSAASAYYPQEQPASSGAEATLTPASVV